MIRIFTVFLFILLFFISAYSQNNVVDKDSIEMRYNSSLYKVSKIYEDIKIVYPIFDRLYPIAIADSNVYYIFDVDGSGKYKLAKIANANTPPQRGIRAAMPLQEYDFKIVCVVTEDAFKDIDNLIIIFHEFVHCVQFNTIELKLKNELDVNQRAIKDKNYMWELNYLFPYESVAFNNEYSNFFDALYKRDSLRINQLRSTMKVTFSQDEYEYMTWEEWKEGYARYIENKLRDRFKVDRNNHGIEKPYNRVTFYAGGSRYIEYIVSKTPELEFDMEKLYYKIRE